MRDHHELAACGEPRMREAFHIAVGRQQRHIFFARLHQVCMLRVPIGRLPPTFERGFHGKPQVQVAADEAASTLSRHQRAQRLRERFDYQRVRAHLNRPNVGRELRYP
jgi:hypothetical protein